MSLQDRGGHPQWSQYTSLTPASSSSSANKPASGPSTSPAATASSSTVPAPNQFAKYPGAGCYYYYFPSPSFVYIFLHIICYCLHLRVFNPESEYSTPQLLTSDSRYIFTYMLNILSCLLRTLAV